MAVAMRGLMLDPAYQDGWNGTPTELLAVSASACRRRSGALAFGL